MHETETPRQGQATTEFRAEILRPDGSSAFRMEQVTVEHVLSIYLDENLIMRIVCTPEYLRELVVGRLFTERIIDSAADIESLTVSDDGTEAHVTLVGDRALKTPDAQFVPTTGAGNRTFRTGDAAHEDAGTLDSIDWTPEWIFSLAGLFSKDSPMHKRTYGAHSCYLASTSEVLYCCEDLGRHNAFDKVLGCALLDGFDLRQAIVFTSGRVPIDMVSKALRAQVPVLVSKAVPTASTVELARKHGLTLICSAHTDSLRVYNDPRWDNA